MFDRRSRLSVAEGGWTTLPDIEALDYATETFVSTALSGYSTTLEMEGAISDALTVYSTTTDMNTAIGTALEDYSTTFETEDMIGEAIGTIYAQNYTTLAAVAGVGYALSSAVTAGDAATLATVAAANYSKNLPVLETAVATTVTNAYSGVVYTGAGNANITIPAGNTWGTSNFTVRAYGAGNITLIRGGSDLFDGGGASIAVAAGTKQILCRTASTLYRLL